MHLVHLSSKSLSDGLNLTCQRIPPT